MILQQYIGFYFLFLLRLFQLFFSLDSHLSLSKYVVEGKKQWEFRGNGVDEHIILHTHFYISSAHQEFF